jgi:hypothetical protein
MDVGRTLWLAGAAALAAASIVSAQPIQETEPNNTFGTANFIPASAYPAGAFAFDGSIVPGDLDWIRFTLAGAPEFIIDAATFGIPNSASGDSQIILVANDQTTILAFDDDSGVGLFSAFEVTVPAGSYYLGITGYNDLGLPNVHLPTGNHTETFQYKLTVGINPIPAPGGVALLSVALAAGLGRRRR